uniref:Beta-methylmalyl-CoA/L-malyl-CoA lyase n=1 Tax=Candidatus Kentrum sp. TUN TaxID=2126343 RepID=A0A450ZYG6_9GAMM|nr:MAG: beta-methylmalyl-CoA/L-malyl-CoA lyase [Candidatus Kentron sp. TUN]VFK58797.1 MAG: beta-methylmalyl-CoA/L-malyl-CoA lyase [Candidatus Kentron sp. TUN]VFK60669.1 MAG: beta-methylmalyl-CoA/L-malyl-CoA lyase [Candidatus Kentron sp. TUN]
MSFTIVEQCTVRLNRSEMAVPASNPRFIDKSTQSAADIILFDLEDAVAPDEKADARRTLIKALSEKDWGHRTLSVRINGLDTPYMYRDIVDVVEQAGDKLDMVMIPKVGSAADVYAVDMLLTQIETAQGFKKRLGIELLIETALGMKNIDEIAAASPRNESLHLGAGDYAASTRMRTVNIGSPHPDYGVLTDPTKEGSRDFHWDDMWHYPTARMVVAARANGLRPVNGPFGDFSDPKGLQVYAKRSAVLGCEGIWAIHPNQVAVANELFTPTEEEVDKAKRVLAAMEQAQKEGKGAVALDGRMIDIVSIKQAQAMVKKSELIVT